jgi:hypothetical protein
MIALDMTKTLRLSDFSRYPAGRFRNDGNRSGQAYREDTLVPELRAAEANRSDVIVDLDGIRLAGSSFFEEAFGGLVREHGWTSAQLRRHLSLKGSDARARNLPDAIWTYIEKASPAG